MYISNVTVEHAQIMQDSKSSYRSIFKATSLFGGVQVYQILIQIIKSKIIAVLLGPAGVGVIGLFQSGLDLVKNLTSMGLASSAVRALCSVAWYTLQPKNFQDSNSSKTLSLDNGHVGINCCGSYFSTAQ